MPYTLGTFARCIAGSAALLSMLCLGGCVNVMATMPTDADARSEQSAVAVAHAYKKASESGLINLDVGSPVKEDGNLRTFNRWWCTGKPTEVAIDELNRLLEANCQARSGRWQEHGEKAAWCEDSKGEGLLFLGIAGGNLWDRAALKGYTVPASQQRGFNCSERDGKHRDVSVIVAEPASGHLLDPAYARGYGYTPTIERYRQRFAAATSAAEWEAFLGDFADFDPDNLRAKAQANLEAAKARVLSSQDARNAREESATNSGKAANASVLQAALRAQGESEEAYSKRLLDLFRTDSRFREAVEANEVLKEAFHKAVRANEEYEEMHRLSVAMAAIGPQTIAVMGQRVLNGLGEVRVDILRLEAIAIYSRDTVREAERLAEREGVRGMTSIRAAALAYMVADPRNQIDGDNRDDKLRLAIYRAVVGTSD